MHSLIKWDPFSELDQFFDNENWMPMIPMRPVIRGFAPAIDVSDNDKEIIIETPLAGIKPRDVEISIKDDILTIRGETKKKRKIIIAKRFDLAVSCVQ